VRLAVNDFGSVLQKKTAVIGLVSVLQRFRFFPAWFYIFLCQCHLSCLYGMTQEMMHFRAELVQLIVSRSDF